MNHSDTPELPEDQLPQDVVAALRKRYGPSGGIPTDRDETVLQDAAAHLSQISQPTAVPPTRSTRRWVAWSTGTLIAAALLVAIVPWNPQEPQSPNVASSVRTDASRDMESLLRGDFDQNGTVDILDAYAMARDLKTGQALPQWDQNGDGKTDRQDVDLIAQTAVTL